MNARWRGILALTCISAGFGCGGGARFCVPSRQGAEGTTTEDPCSGATSDGDASNNTGDIGADDSGTNVPNTSDTVTNPPDTTSPNTGETGTGTSDTSGPDTGESDTDNSDTSTPGGDTSTTPPPGPGDPGDGVPETTTGGAGCACGWAAYCGPDSCGVQGADSACQCASGFSCDNIAPFYQCMAGDNPGGSPGTGGTTTPTTSTAGVRVQVADLPAALSGYSIDPFISYTRSDTGVGSAKALPWSATTVLGSLADNALYSFSTPEITFNDQLCSGRFNPTELVSTADASAITQLTFQCAPVEQADELQPGRMVGYLPGWKVPPPAGDLASAGYTHMLVAFGLFSTTEPGKIVGAFDTITPAYIAALHSAGIKALLSLGGASSSVASAVTDFHQVLSAAASPSVFIQTFVASVEEMVVQYEFDGIDIDIEHGLGVGGTFTQPTGDVGVMAIILNQLKARNPNLLITLVPQVANIAATSGFDSTWGNYAALIMQTSAALAWVGIQLYNTGCAYGIDQVCYANDETSAKNSPDFAVAMATDLLADWPTKDATGRATGFQPYKALLTPDQVLIGFPAPSSTGDHDGGPVTPTPIIKRAIECLRTGVASPTACDTFVPPSAYAGFGGVFNWEVTYDQDNGYGFATDLSSCILHNHCE